MSEEIKKDGTTGLGLEANRSTMRVVHDDEVAVAEAPIKEPAGQKENLKNFVNKVDALGGSSHSVDDGVKHEEYVNGVVDAIDKYGRAQAKANKIEVDENVFKDFLQDAKQKMMSGTPEEQARSVKEHIEFIKEIKNNLGTEKPQQAPVEGEGAQKSESEPVTKGKVVENQESKWTGLAKSAGTIVGLVAAKYIASEMFGKGSSALTSPIVGAFIMNKMTGMDLKACLVTSFAGQMFGSQGQALAKEMTGGGMAAGMSEMGGIAGMVGKSK